MESKTDIRIMKTRQNIKASFINLLKKKPLTKITIKEICDGAMCSRNTFYMYYPYKEALYDELLEETIQNVLKGFDVVEDYVPGKWEETFDIYLRNIIEALSQIKGIFYYIPPQTEEFNLFIGKLSRALTKHMEHWTKGVYQNQNWDSYKAANRYLVGGIIEFSIYWLTETDLSAEDALKKINPVFRATIEVMERYLTA